MSVASLIEYVMSESQYLPQAESPVAVVELAERDREEVLGFLAERPIHTVAMAGLIRGNGTARAYLTRLCRRLLPTTRTICLLANEENERAQRFYRTCGFKMRRVYDTLFLRRD